MKVAARILAALLLALVAFFGYAGYFDREAMVEVQPAARPIPSRDRLAAVYFSGDIGYRVAMGQALGDRLAADGIPVIAINSLRYFRSHRSVPEVTGLTAEAIRRALALGRDGEVVLIGHSLGADALQAGLAGLPQQLRAKVRAVILIVPTRELNLRVSPAEMLDLAASDGDTLPSLSRLTWVPLTCIHGVEEADSPCSQLSAASITRVALPGGHQLEWNADRVHDAVLAAIDAASAAKMTKSSESDHPGAIPQGARTAPPPAT